MDDVLAKYKEIATELAKGLDIPVKVSGDIDKLDQLLIAKAKEAAEANRQLTSVVREQGQAIANTTNTISRELMEQEKVNKASREAYTEQGKVAQILEQVNGKYKDHVTELVKLNKEISDNAKGQKELKKQLDNQAISVDEYNTRMANLIKAEREAKQERSNLTTLMRNEEKEAAAVSGSYTQMSQQLELMKKAYKEMNEEGRSSELGTEMEAAIQNLDAHLKDMAADMGEFQRNVGNYAIAGQNGVVSTESLNAAMLQEAKTTQDLIDQTKILEEGKVMLDKNDANYETTLATLNKKLEENKRKLSDVSDIINKDATSVAEAESQNKRLQEALKHVDLTSEGAQERIKVLNERIARNTQLIRENTPAIQDQTKAFEQQKKANEGAADQLLTMVGANHSFGSSLQQLGQSNAAGVFDGLKTKIAALGKTVLGLVSNPWVLSFLGLASVAAGVKWWYDYNKGMIEASRLTKNFTDLTGQAADKVTADISAMADELGKSYNDTISAANQIVQQFGVSWKDAIQIMEDGIVAGADMNGRMIENINQYSGAFKDAGMSAEQFMSILAETRNGVFDDKALKSITDASTRLRAMTTSTSAALDAIGISSKQMQQDLQEGNITMLEAIQQVTDKMKEIPPNAQETGEVMKNVFGRKAAASGETLLKSISDINDNLEVAKERMGELGKVNERQMQANRELQETIASIFKMSGTTFEEMTKSAKTYITEGLTKVIKGCVDIVNWFIRIYNKSLVLRAAVSAIGVAFKTTWNVIKLFAKQIYNTFSSMADVIEGVFTLDFDKIKKGVKEGFDRMSKNMTDYGKDNAQAYADAFNSTLHGEMKEVSVGLDGDIDVGGNGTGTTSTGTGTTSTGLSDKELKAQQKAAEQALKILQELEEQRVELMEEGHEKELATIRLKYKKKVDAIKGNSENEKQLRIQLALAMEKEIAKCQLQYQQSEQDKFLSNDAKLINARLSSVKKGTQEELDLRLELADNEMSQELVSYERALQKKEITQEEYDELINAAIAKNMQERSQIYTDFNQSQYEEQADQRAADLADQQAALKAQYAADLAACGNNEKEKARIKKRYEQSAAIIAENYAVESAQAQVDMLEKLLKDENLTDTQREDLAKKLAEAKTALANATADADIAATERATAADKESWQKRMDNAQAWVQKVSEALNAINSLASAIYDGKIQQIEDEQDALDDASEAEQDRITELVDQNVITEEEGEARKRAAEEKTAKKNEELEKKKQQLEYKQAVWDKANSVAQCGIQTALALMKLWVDPGWPAALPMMAVVSALGAIQLATILATPIPKYAKGTDYHKGGLALVGDAGKQEVVSYNGDIWFTPNRPTLVDLPQGAAVAPSIEDYMANSTPLITTDSASNKSIIINDYSELKQEVATLAMLIKQQTKQQHRDSRDYKYELFKTSRI
jgi:hypothetical protein